MTQSKHTPAPWMPQFFSKDVGIWAEGRKKKIATIKGLDTQDWIKKSEMEANAQLIATAPELLEEAERAAIRLESLIEYLERQEAPHFLHKRRIALEIQNSLEEISKKARGES